MNPEQLSLLLEKYATGMASPEEIAELNQWYRDNAYFDGAFPDEEEITGERILNRIEVSINHRPARRFRKYYWYASAAAVLIVFGVSFLFRTASITSATKPVIALAQKPVVPGGNKAVLTLSGGKQIILNNVQSNQIARQGSSVVNKSGAGSISYQPDVTIANTAEEISYNTLSTPNGGQYAVVLADGTKVWLNAHSSLTYPTAFTGEERNVKLTGEAYFEVAKDPSRPFRVDVDGKQQITVLGTHFDIEAYSDDHQVNTTLLEGSVKLTTSNKQVLMKPGQTVVNDLSGTLVTKPADIDEVLAWKNGLFVFNDENIKDVMKKVARWYDIDVIYQDDVTGKRLGGIVSRYKNITDLMNNITKTGGIHYQVKERRVILMK